MGLGTDILRAIFSDTSEYDKRMEARRRFEKRFIMYMFTQGVVGAVLFIMKAVNPAYGWIWYSKTVLFWKFFVFCATNLVRIIVGYEGLDDYDSLHIAAYCLSVSSVLDIFYVLYKVAQVVAPGFLPA